MATLSLGQTTQYPDQYDPSLLFPIPRAENRAKLGLKEGQALPFVGVDIWNAFELSWLNKKGKPQIALAEFQIPADSPNMIESKSFKLYLNSFSNTRFDDMTAVRERLRADLGAAIWHGGAIRASVGVQLIPPEQFERESVQELDGLLLDRLDIECDQYQPQAQYLSANTDEQPVTETLTSHLLKSNCLVTGQPDWGSVRISYHGPQIDQEGLLKYLISFRNHHEFHEHCVETIFTDIKRQCKPEKLSVYARYTRRGGLDINPFRTDHNSPWPENVRHARQ